MVRLEDVNSYRNIIAFLISIPCGAIRRRPRKTLQALNDPISIPCGAIRSYEEDPTWFIKIYISIPCGAIRSPVVDSFSNHVLYFNSLWCD